MPALTKATAIEKLNLIAHIEGGYFSETFRTAEMVHTEREGGERHRLTSIFYMLTDEGRKGAFHMNKSDIVHYFQGGSTLTYYIIHPDGQLEIVKLGSNLADGDVMQMEVKGGCWKGTYLPEGEFGLLGEAVAPGFDYRDMVIAKKEDIQAQFPAIFDQIAHMFE